MSQDLRKWNQICDPADGTTDGNQGKLSCCGWIPPSTAQTSQESQRSKARRRTAIKPMTTLSFLAVSRAPLTPFPRRHICHPPAQSIRPFGSLGSPCAFPCQRFPRRDVLPRHSAFPVPGGHTLVFRDPFFPMRYDVGFRIQRVRKYGLK